MSEDYSPPGIVSEMDRKFWQFHHENPSVYAELKVLALQAKERGRSRFGIKMLFEVVRWQRFLRTEDPEGWKLNNNYHSRYARLLMAQEPELRGLFHRRELRT